MIRRVSSNLNFRCFCEIKHDAGGNSGGCVISVRGSFKFSVTFFALNFKTVYVLLFCDVA